MSEPLIQHDPLLALLSTVCDGRATDSDRARLDALLRADPDARSLYLRYTALHATLDRRRLHAAIPPAANPHPTPPRPWRTPTLRPPKRLVLRLAAAALLLLAAAAVAIYVTSFYPRPETKDSKLNPPIATVLDTTPGSTLVVDDSIANPGDEVRSGDISLDSGSADFRLSSGVNVALRGQTQLTVHSPMSATLTRGSATFDCPPAAVGYTVQLPDGSRIVDLGTAFGVRVDDAGAATVRVTNGRVTWTTPGPIATSVLIDARQIARLVDGRIVVTDAPAFIAYHDLGGEPSPGHITTHRTLDQTIRLIDHATGDDTGVELTITGAIGISHETGVTRAPAPGTPADALFGGAGLDLDEGVITVGGNAPSTSMKITLAGLDPTRRYDLALYGDRGLKPDGPERFSLVGAEGATNASSSGVVDSTTTLLETRPNAHLGHVVRWTDIIPGPDGAVEVRVQINAKNLAYVSAIRLATSDRDNPSREHHEARTAQGITKPAETQSHSFKGERP